MCVNDNMYFDRYYVYIQYMPSPIHVHVNVCSIVYICKYCVCPYGPYGLLDVGIKVSIYLIKTLCWRFESHSVLKLSYGCSSKIKWQNRKSLRNLTFQLSGSIGNVHTSINSTRLYFRLSVQNHSNNSKIFVSNS